MSATREESEGASEYAGRAANPESLLWTRLTPFRSHATRLGFDFLRRECSAGNGITRRVNLFLHPSGIWLELRASVDRSMRFGSVVAAFRSWALDGDELIEVTTLAATPLPDDMRLSRSLVDLVERLLGAGRDVQPLDSPDDLTTVFARHRALLAARSLTPLIAGDEPLEDRNQWEQTVAGNVWLIAPP